MGRGNYIPSNHESLANGFFYVYSEDMTDPFWYDDFKDDLLSSLPKSFQSMSYQSDVNLGRDEMYFIENQFVRVLLSDNEWSIAVCLQEIESNYSYRNFAGNYIHRVLPVIMRKMKKFGYKIHIRTSSWTSSEWKGDE